MIHLIIYFLVLFVFAQYYSVCLFNSVLLCKVMSTQSALNDKAYNHQIHPSPVHQAWWSHAVPTVFDFPLAHCVGYPACRRWKLISLHSTWVLSIHPLTPPTPATPPCCCCPCSFWHEPIPDLHCAELSCAAIRENHFEAFQACVISNVGYSAQLAVFSTVSMAGFVRNSAPIKCA